MSKNIVEYNLQQSEHVGQTRDLKVKEQPGNTVFQHTTPNMFPESPYMTRLPQSPSAPRGPAFDCLVSMRKQSPFSPAAAKSLCWVQSCEDVPTCIPEMAT